MIKLLKLTVLFLSVLFYSSCEENNDNNLKPKYLELSTDKILIQKGKEEKIYIEVV